MPKTVQVRFCKCFPPRHRAAFEAYATDPRGWARHGHRFRFDEGAAADTLVTVHYKSSLALLRKFQHVDGFVRLYGLSITDSTVRGRPQLYVNSDNWERPPETFRAARGKRRERLYREYLVQHELGHCLGLDHPLPGGACDDPAAACPTMCQQSRAACRADPWNNGD